MFNIGDLVKKLKDVLSDDVRDELREFKTSINDRLNGFQSSLKSPESRLVNIENQTNKRIDFIIDELRSDIKAVDKISDIHRDLSRG
ncbi:MAG: hypothetical protein N2Z80_06160 [Hydrogenothermaceae bacterium]|nr:hypothetical protein [Hydrogenothermaceae bacterium]